jgi:O-methyltransferase
MILRKITRKFFNAFGYDLIKRAKHEKSFDEYAEFMDVYELCKPYTMTTVERMYSLYKAVEYIIRNNIKGNFVECGVWRGGSSMLIAATLKKFNVTDRKIYLYDTFEGMSMPTEKDVNLTGRTAADLMRSSEKSDSSTVWCYADMNDVDVNMKKTGYPFENIHLVKGKVEDTIPATLPESQLALLRLDTDWYESTTHEMNHLYPLLTKNGVLILDDYGHWQGAKQAVDEYFTQKNISLLLNRIDYTGRIAIIA